MVAFEKRDSKKSTDSCPSSAGDPHEQFGRYSVASLQSLLQEIMGPDLQSWNFKNTSWNIQEFKVAHQEPISWPLTLGLAPLSFPHTQIASKTLSFRVSRTLPLSLLSYATFLLTLALGDFLLLFSFFVLGDFVCIYRVSIPQIRESPNLDYKITLIL